MLGKIVAELAFLNYIYAREITNGMWFFASLFLLASMLRVLYPQFKIEWRVWLWPVHLKMAWGITLLCFGNMLRAGWIWSLLIANELGAVNAVRMFERSAIVSYIAIGFGVWGAVCTVKAITEAVRTQFGQGYPWLYWAFVVGVTVGVPIVVGAAT